MIERTLSKEPGKASTLASFVSSKLDVFELETGLAAVLSFFIPEMAVDDYVYAMVKASRVNGNIAAATAQDPANCCMSVWRVA